MFSWLKSMLQKEQPATNTVIIEAKPDVFVREEIILSEPIDVYLKENGTESTLSWLLEQLCQDLSGSSIADLFTGYYDGEYSKKDILDRYEEIITIDEAVVEALAKLGESYNPEVLHNIYTQKDCYMLFSEKFFLDLVEEITLCQTNMKLVKRAVWEEYFDCVKESLNTKKKSGITNSESQYQPRDEIEATLIMLLQADMKARRNE